MKANTWIRNCFILAKDSRSRNRNWFSYETQVQYTEIGQFYTGILMYWAIIENMISPDYVLCYIPWQFSVNDGNFGSY